MLDTLRRLIQEVNDARNIEQALNIIVNRVKSVLQADVCSVYLRDPKQKDYVLRASVGLHTDVIGKVRLKKGEGLVGLVAKRAELVNLADASVDPRYCYIPDSGEEIYHAFLAVPTIHRRYVVGVLVVQSTSSTVYTEDDETLLITIAAQLAEAIAHADASGELEDNKSSSYVESRAIQGQPGAPGITVGHAVVMYPFADIHAIPDRKITNITSELIALDNAIRMVKKDINKMKESLSDKLSAEELVLFDVFNMMLESESFTGVMRNRVEAGNWAPGSLRETVIEHERIFSEMEDAYLRERIDDIRDLGHRLLKYLQNEEQVHRTYSQNTILVGEDITAAMLAEIPIDSLAGVISVRGSRTSHIAILARAMGIPTIMGATDLPVGLIDGCQVVLDGYAGRIYINPDKVVLAEYQRLINEEADLREELAGINDFPAETVDGTHIPLYVNTGLLADLSPIRDSGAEGIGLYRTEYPFMIRQSFPSEAEQARVYRKVLEECAPYPVVLRTLDIGGDKALPYFPIIEENPFLGWRGIRITLDHPEIFLVQIRAMMRASIGLNNLSILLPMICDVAELNDALALIHQAYEELMEEQLNIVMPRIGVMIEVPSAVYQAGALARRVDFLSIGTNDLTQYLLAVDRNNPRVAELYDSLHPAVIRAMLQVVESARVHGKPVSVCGEMAGDPVAAVILVGMGIHSLSMSVTSLSRVKWVIRNIASEQAEEILSEILTMDNVKQIRQTLTNKLEFAGMGGLVRAGK